MSIYSVNDFSIGDLRQEIFQYLDPKDLSRCAAVCKTFRETILDNNFIWAAVAQRMRSPFDLQDIPTPRKNGAMRLRVRGFVLDFKKAIKSFNENGIPKDIQDIVNDPNAPSESQINLLKNYCKARDTIIVWEKVAERITQNVDLPLDLYKSADTIIAKANEFRDWLDVNRTRLAQLESLYLNGNQLTCLPKEIGKLSSLEGLYLDGNQLTCLPEEIGNLSSLEGLYLDGNQLTCLPKEIGNLSSLEWLHLNGNRLTCLPEEIGNLSSLKWLYLDGNQLTILARVRITVYMNKGQILKIGSIIGICFFLNFDLLTNAMANVSSGVQNIAQQYFPGINNLF